MWGYPSTIDTHLRPTALPVLKACPDSAIPVGVHEVHPSVVAQTRNAGGPMRDHVLRPKRGIVRWVRLKSLLESLK